MGPKADWQLLGNLTKKADWLARKPINRGGQIDHSDSGSQSFFIEYTERLVEAVIGTSVSSIGDPFDNALAETVNGL